MSSMSIISLVIFTVVDDVVLCCGVGVGGGVGVGVRGIGAGDLVSGSDGKCGVCGGSVIGTNGGGCGGWMGLIIPTKKIITHYVITSSYVKISSGTHLFC